MEISALVNRKSHLKSAELYLVMLDAMNQSIQHESVQIVAHYQIRIHAKQFRQKESQETSFRLVLKDLSSVVCRQTLFEIKRPDRVTESAQCAEVRVIFWLRCWFVDLNKKNNSI